MRESKSGLLNTLDSHSTHSRSILKSAGVMSIAVFLSRILGLVREQVFAAMFGASHATDAFQIAFRIPNLLRDLFAEGAMSAALVPTFVSVQNKEGAERGWQLATRVFVILFLFVSALAVIGMCFAEPLVQLYASAYKEIPGKFELTVRMTQMMMPFFPLVALAAAFMAILNACGKYFIPAFASALFNLVSIIVGVGCAHFFARMGRDAIEGMAIGVVAGGLIQAFAQWPLLRKVGYRAIWDHPLKQKVFHDPALRQMMFLMIPGTIGLAATQINILVNSVFATSVGPGAVSWLNYAFRLMQFPIGIFGVSLASATLPVFSRSWSSNLHSESSAALEKSIKRVFAINFPASAGLAFLGVPIISMIFEHGRFQHQDTVATAQALAAYSVGLTAYSVVKVLVPVCYAMGRTKAAVWSSFFSVVMNFVFNLLLVEKLGFMGLALGTSLTAILNSLLLWFFVSRSFVVVGVAPPSKNLLVGLIKYSFAALLMGAVVFSFDTYLFSEASRVFRVVAGVILGVGSYLGLSFLLKCQESLELFDLIKRRLGHVY